MLTLNVMSTTQNKPELLAPAGNLETALAAFASGADAVYCGLGKYNAREMAENFTFEDMSKLSAYTKKHNKKFYLTFNTLLKQNELQEAAEQLFYMAQLRPDGVIVQDIGVAAILREFFPSMPVHASTQMGIHNSAGVAMAADMGMERVILERQVTFDELERIIEQSKLEIEVFIHGALCCSLSGKCLFSSWIGGWSGNRGRCKQPCRRRYYSQTRAGKKAGFYFSTQDLYTLDLIPELKRLGVASLKIEGRLKKPSYIQSVVQAYRMVIDADDDQFSKIIGPAKQVLSGAYGRKWSHGFASEQDMATILQPGNVGVSGLLVGSVKDANRGKIQVSLKRKLHVGDRIRFQSAGGEESPGFTIRTLEKKGSPVKSAAQGDVTIPFQRDIEAGSKVYKVSQSVKKDWPDAETLPLYRTLPELDLSVTIKRNLIQVKVDNYKDEKLEWSQPIELEDAKKHGISTSEVERIFLATGEKDFAVGKVMVDCENGLFMPPSLLKKLRREFWDYITPHIEKDNLENVKQAQLKKIKSWVIALKGAQGKEECTHVHQHTKEVSVIGKKTKKGGRNNITVDSLYSYSKHTKEIELPHFCPEGALATVKEKIANAIENGIRRFRVTDIYQFILLREYGNLHIVTGFPLPVTNAKAVEKLEEFGVQKVQAWVELDREGLLALEKASPVQIELFCYGKPFLLATRARVDAEGEISDPRGRKFYTEYSKIDGITYIFPYEILQIPEIHGVDEFYDYRHVYEKGNPVSSFNYETEFV